MAETTTTAPVESDSVFDFSAIEGKWIGVVGEETDLPPLEVSASFDPEARRGTPAAKVKIRELSVASDLPSCNGTWSALQVDGPRYMLFQALRDCDGWGSGTVHLLHETAKDTLLFTFSFEGEGRPYTGTLERVAP